MTPDDVIQPISDEDRDWLLEKCRGWLANRRESIHEVHDTTLEEVLALDARLTAETRRREEAEAIIIGLYASAKLAEGARTPGHLRLFIESCNNIDDQMDEANRERDAAIARAEKWAEEAASNGTRLFVAQREVARLREHWAAYKAFLMAKYPAAPGQAWAFTCPHHQAIDAALAVTPTTTTTETKKEGEG